MRALRFLVRYPDGRAEDFAVDAERVLIGSGAHCEIRLPVDQAAMEHVAVTMSPTSVMAEARAFEPPPTINGSPFQRAALMPDAILGVGAIQISVMPVEVAGTAGLIQRKQEKTSPMTYVLAAIAVPSFQSQYHQSKSAEAQALLRDIAAKQDAYKAEFGQFLNVSGWWTFDARRPVDAPRVDFGYRDWVGSGDGIYTAWNQLGFRPQSAVRYGYVTVAGLPGTAPNSLGVPAGLAGDGNDHWWAAAAFGNADRSGVGGTGDCSQFYLSSVQNIMGVVNESR